MHFPQMEKEEKLWAKWMAELSEQTEEFWYNHGRRKNFYMTAEQVMACGVVEEVF